MFGRESKLQIDFIISVSVDGCGEEEGSADQWLVEHLVTLQEAPGKVERQVRRQAYAWKKMVDGNLKFLPSEIDAFVRKRPII